MSIVSVVNLGKSFRIYRSEFHRMLGWFFKSIKPVEEKWVLKNISFDVGNGEAIGIIGQNGAGKSTLLKMLSGTLAPTTGVIAINGKIAALLELGMGFNPDLTGRENVLNTAGLMGYEQSQILEIMPEIEEFAEIGTYFDEPLRIYSSGMQVRLAFSVATAFRPEILIVDEALSVGDAYFQHKSFNKIKEFQKLGTTLLLVSHDRSAVTALCNRALLIEDGSIRKDGPPEEVLDLYNALIAEKETSALKQIELQDGRVQTISGTGEVVIQQITLRDQNGKETDNLNVGDAAELEIICTTRQPVPELVVGYMIKDRLGQPIFGTNSYNMGQVLKDLSANETRTFRYKFPANFGAGNYSIAVSLHQSNEHVAHNYEWRDLAYTFVVVNSDKPIFVGSAWVPPTLEIT